MDKQSMLLAAAIVTVALVLFAAVAVAKIRRAKSQAAQEPQTTYGYSRARRRRHGLHRSLIAAVSVAPGAVLLGWGVTALVVNLPVGTVMGWIPGCLLAVALAGFAYMIVENSRKALRTWVALAIGISANAAYLAMLWAYLLFTK